MRTMLVIWIGVLFAALLPSALAEHGVYSEEERSSAENPPRLYLFPKPGGIDGWVAGRIGEAGDGPRVVQLSDGATSVEVELDSRGCFSWEGDAEQLTVKSGDLAAQVVTLPSVDEAARSPVAFLVVDRSVCRPDSTLEFAAFLRKADGEGGYIAVANAEVEVQLTSKSKGIRVASLKLQSDDFGRVSGEYRFSNADPRDDYALTVRDYAGEATVKLAEFRKAKVRLDIVHEEIASGVLKLNFRPVDFLGQTVPASDLQIDLAVRREVDSDPRLWGLDPEQFAEWNDDSQVHPYQLSVEQRALMLAGEAASSSGAPSEVFSVSRSLKFGDDGVAEYRLTLDPSWKHGHVLEVNGSIIDGNQREQKAAKRIVLGGEDEAETGFAFSLERSEVQPGETFGAILSGPGEVVGSLVVFRLQSRVDELDPVERMDVANPFLQRHAVMPHRGWIHSLHRGQIVSAAVQRIAREFHSLTPLVLAEGEQQKLRYEGELRIAKPGAYMVRALARTAEGREISLERSVVVRSEKRANGVFLELESDRLSAGESLRGRVESRFEGAQVLLALRDGNGVRTLLPLTLEGESSEFEIDLPENLTTGCELTARYSDDARTLHLHRRSFAVEPKALRLEISSEIPQVLKPGEEVEMTFSVNRKQATDLVVSVYDESLLGIAPDPGIDGASFFHADVRVEDEAVARMLKSYLGSLSLAELAAQLEAVVEETAVDQRPPEFIWDQLTMLKNSIQHRSLQDSQVAILLAWLGAPIDIESFYRNGYHYGGATWWHLQNLSDADLELPVMELLDRVSDYQTRLKFTLIGEKLIYYAVGDGANSNTAWLGQSQLLWGSGHIGNDMMFFGGRDQLSVRFLEGGRARGDSMRGSWVGISGNASISGQALHSHLPVNFALAAPATGPGAATGGAEPAIHIRRDFSDSAFFDAAVRTDEEGRATVKFQLPDSLTNWRVVVTGVSRDLAVGRHTASFQTHQPVMVWPMLSQSFTSGDRSGVFALVHNRTDEGQQFTVSASAKNGRFHGDTEHTVTIDAKASAPVYFDYEAGEPGFTEILMTAKCATGEDASLKRLPVHPCTAEQIITEAGFARGRMQLEIPEGVDFADSRLEITIAPSIAGDMLDSLDYLVAYPHGCVEQTMSRFLPLIKVTQILKRFDIEDEELRQRADTFSEAGIKRLLSLQNEDGGWGWQGNGGTHEMMTPYALFGLIEAEKGGFEIPSDAAMKKGMDRLGGFVDAMTGETQSADRIYCMWVYQHRNELPDAWWAWLEDLVKRTLSTPQKRSDLLSDYAAALSLEMAVKSERPVLAGKLARLLELRAEGTDGQSYWTTANFSRWGDDRFEITAAVLKAFAAFDPDHSMVPSTIQFFASTKRGNRWNSTKDTAMILYALCEYLSTRQMQSPGDETETLLAVDGVEHRLVTEGWRSQTITIDGADLASNQPEIAFLDSDPTHLCRVVFRHWKQGREIEAVSEGVSVSRTLSLINRKGEVIRQLKSGDSVPRGSLIRSVLTASSDQPFNYTLAVNPKPSCAEFSTSAVADIATQHALKEEKASGAFWHHEVLNDRRLNNAITYRAELAGEFLVAPAYVELMYDTATRGHSDSFRLRVTDDGKSVASAEAAVESQCEFGGSR